MTYPRYNKPSGSSVYRVRNCPGSHKRELLFPEKNAKDAKTGDRIHAHLAGALSRGMLNAQEAQTADMCREQEERLVAEWSNGEGVQVVREQRLGLTAYGKVIEVTPETKAEIVFTAQFDVLHIQEERGIVLDYKSLFGDVPDAVDNEQIWSNAYLVAEKYKLKSVRGGIIQPRVGKPTIVDFDEQGLAQAKSFVHSVLDAEIKATIDDVSAGEWCKYCKAKLGCPAYAAAREKELAVFNPDQIAHLDRRGLYGAMMGVAGQMSDEELIGRFQGLAIPSLYPQIIKDEMRRRAAEKANFPYEERAVREKGNREITDAQKAFALLQNLHITEADMISASTVSVTKLQEFVRIRSGQKSVSSNGAIRYNLTDKQAKEQMALALGDVLQNKEPPLELVPVNNVKEIEL